MDQTLYLKIISVSILTPGQIQYSGTVLNSGITVGCTIEPIVSIANPILRVAPGLPAPPTGHLPRLAIISITNVGGVVTVKGTVTNNQNNVTVELYQEARGNLNQNGPIQTNYVKASAGTIWTTTFNLPDCTKSYIIMASAPFETSTTQPVPRPN